MKIHGTIALALLLVILASPSGQADNYVSWKGGFYITYPDHWKQIDYQTVDVFLYVNQADRDALDYEAVFADSSSRPFFEGSYVILTLDTVAEMSQLYIDSALRDLEEAFNRSFTYSSVADFFADTETNTLNYDDEKRLVTIISDVVKDGQVIKKNLMMMQFYEKGMASFYLYSPDSLFEQAKGLLHDMVISFSTENIEAAAGSQIVRVADAAPEQETAQPDDSEDSSKIYLIVGVALAMILFVVIRRLK
ncbi:MAG: hypothetical protein KAU35_08950 [candidate division Zixibacteria bacterium]|nr:hypothetical protein [candidate division Zixibacteria bacterium]